MKLNTVNARSKLKARPTPYAQRVSKGNYVCFRRWSAESAGTWLARSRDASTGKQRWETLGDLSDLPDHERYDAALKAANAWFAHLDKGGITAPKTVKDACDAKVKQLRTDGNEKAAKDFERRFKTYVLDDPEFAALELRKLTPAIIKDWKTRLIERPVEAGPNRGKRRTDGTLNRDITPFRAALNLACDEQWITSDFAWRKHLKVIEDADGTRDIYLDKDQRRALIDAAAPDIAMFMRGMSMVPLRPGPLAKFDARNYESRLCVLSIGKDESGEGIDKNKRDRKITLPPESAAFFAEAKKNKLPAAPLFARADGVRWEKDKWKHPVRDAVNAAREREPIEERKLPKETTIYAIRHSVITDLISVHGLDLLTVAKLADTSLAMIQKTYGHLVKGAAEKALAGLAL